MAESGYAVRKAEQRNQLPEIDLLPVISHNGKNLDIAIFGPNTYGNNLDSMKKAYFHSAQLPKITFRPSQTSESISAVDYDFENMAKPQVLDLRWLQAGPIVRTKEGVFTNTNEIDESRLKQLLNGVKKVNGIYLIDDKIAFAPYDSFKTGVQDVDTFAQGGLARVLEHTSEKTASKLREIGSPKFYKRGVNVWGFDSSKNPILRVASLCSVVGRLDVGGDSWYGDGIGYAFGVLDKSRSDAPKN